MNLLYALVALLLYVVGVLCENIEFDLENDQQHDNSTQAMYDQLSLDSLRWGPYRSGNYFGVRPRIPFSLMSGLMWFNADDHVGFGTLKHNYEQGHNVSRANWIEYDPRFGGRQVISDNDCHINVTIDFVKSDNGRNWGVKVAAVPHKGYEKVKTSFVWYSGLEGLMIDETTGLKVPNGFLKLENEPNPLGYRGTVTLSGLSEDLGGFDIQINDGGENVKNKHPSARKVLIPELNPKRTHHLSLRVPDGSVWQGEAIFVTLLQDSIKDFSEKFKERAGQIPASQGLLLRDINGYEGNFHLVQKMFVGQCEFDIVFNELGSPPTEKVTFENINSRVASALAKIDSKFEKHFPLSQMSDSEKTFGKELLSGLLGGLSYFYGDHLVDRTTTLDDDNVDVDSNGDVHLPKFKGSFEGPFELFTLVPSRPFFPRGFYWDEGFHLLPLLEYDSDLALEIIKSWFDLIDDNGWIAREQILGVESRERVPREFVDQSTEIVNPPTIMLAFTFLLERAHGDSEHPVNLDAVEGDISANNLGNIVLSNPELLANYTRTIYPKLKLHYESFKRSQQGTMDEFDRDGTTEAYRWRGRTTSHCLASGLDDYPRSLPMDSAELHVDLLCWIGVMTRSIKRIAELLDIEGDVKLYNNIEDEITNNIARFHWSDDEKCYCDVTVDDEDENVHACFKGYISLFPFLTKFIPSLDVDKLESVVKLIADPEELWTEYGIRSMAKSSDLYRTGENYWRSPIWMNINYLVLDSLKHYYDASGPYASPELKQLIDRTYTDLRKNIIKNVKKEWEVTGFVWENYDDQTGQARGAKNFLGWSSLVLLMMEMPVSLHKQT